MVYLDNAATSFPKPLEVYEGIDGFIRNYCANPGRSGHEMSLVSGKAVSRVREIISNFFNFNNPMRLCFTKNATEALNIAIKGILKSGGHVITTSMEHNSVMRPLKSLQKEIGIEISIIKGNQFGEIDPGDIENNIKSNTAMIISTLSSNVNGTIIPVKEIGKTARNNGITFLVDASQGAGTMQVDVEKMNIDLLAFPGHKGLLGPQGTGGLYIREGLEIGAIIEGGTGSNSKSLYQPEIMPDILESGTLNTPGIVGLGLGVEFINDFGLPNINLYKNILGKRLYDGMYEIKRIKIYSLNEIKKNSGIIAINFENTDSTEISYILDKDYHIATRAGLHCAPLAHETLGTLESGVVRFSIGCFNTVDEIDFTLKALQEISERI